MSQHDIFDIAAWFTALVSTWLVYRWRFRSRVETLSERLGAGYFIALSGGGLVGAFLFGTLNVVLSGQAGGGRSILGGLLGSIAMIYVYKGFRGIRGSTGAVFAVPFALAVLVGRIGCYRAGLPDFTYGTPTNLPWGVDFGDGIPRHPVQLYESFTMGIVALVLVFGLWRRSQWAMAGGFYVAVGIYGVQRFFWEFLKPYGTLIGPLNLFHVLCLILTTYAVGMLYIRRHEEP